MLYRAVKNKVNSTHSLPFVYQELLIEILEDIALLDTGLTLFELVSFKQFLNLHEIVEGLYFHCSLSVCLCVYVFDGINSLGNLILACVSVTFIVKAIIMNCYHTN